MKKSGITLALCAAAAMTMGGCANYVKRVDYDAAISELCARDSSIEAKADANAAALASLRSELNERFAKYDKAIAEAAGRLHIDTIAYFDYSSSTLRDEDKPALDDFARVISEHHAGTLITVEGFTDAAGDAGFNKRLGLRRAEAVRDYLVSSGGLAADSVRAVTYGETRERQVAEGAWGENGQPNRRASLVVERVGG
jgi:peptidoglycan-associated lipoprotein